MAKKKAKAAALRALMGNQKLADDIFAGQEALSGSTKKKRASGIMNSVNRELDGMGGPGDGPDFQSMITPEQAAPSSAAPASKALTEIPPAGSRITSQAPTLDTLFGKPKNPLILNEEGGVTPPPGTAGALSGPFTGDNSGVPSYAQQPNAFAGTGVPDLGGYLPGSSTGATGEATAAQPGLKIAGSPDTSVQKAAPAIDRTSAGQFGEVPSLKPRSEVSDAETYPTLTEEEPTDTPPVDTQSVYGPPETENGESADRIGQLDQGTSDAYYAACSAGGGEYTKCRDYAVTETGKVPSTEVVSIYHPEHAADNAADTSPVDIQEMLKRAQETGDPTEILQWYAEAKKGSPDQAAAAERIKDLIDKGYSPETIGQLAMFNMDLFSEASGVPKELLESFTFDLFGGKKAEDLLEIAEEKNKMNLWEAEVLDRNVIHLNSSQKYQDYMSGRDKFVGKLDEMLWKLGEERKNIDFSDPHMRKRYDSHKNYLQGLRNSQQKRYIDVLTMSINKEQADYDRFTAAYNAQVAKVDKIVNMQIGQQTLDQQTAMTLLPIIAETVTKAANAISGKDKLMDDAWKKQLQLNQAVSQLTHDIAQQDFKLGAGTTGRAGQISAGDNKFIESDYKLEVTRKVDTDGNITAIEARTPGQILDWGRNLDLSNVSGVLDRYGRDVSRYIEREIGQNGNLDAADAFVDLIDFESVSEEEKPFVVQYASMVVNGTKAGMRTHYAEEKGAEMKKVMTALIRGKVDSSADLVAKYGNLIDSEILKYLWENYEVKRQEIYDGAPESFNSLEEVPVFGIERDDWNEILNKPEELVKYFIA